MLFSEITKSIAPLRRKANPPKILFAVWYEKKGWRRFFCAIFGIVKCHNTVKMKYRFTHRCFAFVAVSGRVTLPFSDMRAMRGGFQHHNVSSLLSLFFPSFLWGIAEVYWSKKRDSDSTKKTRKTPEIIHVYRCIPVTGTVT